MNIHTKEVTQGMQACYDTHLHGFRPKVLFMRRLLRALEYPPTRREMEHIHNFLLDMVEVLPYHEEEQQEFLVLEERRPYNGFPDQDPMFDRLRKDHLYFRKRVKYALDLLERPERYTIPRLRLVEIMDEMIDRLHDHNRVEHTGIAKAVAQNGD